MSPSSPYRRSFLVLSKPKIGDLKDPKDVRGVYTCVERVFEMKKDEDGVELFFAITVSACLL